MTATTKFLAGSMFNLFGRGTLHSSDANGYYPRENVADGDPSIPFKFGSIQTDGWIKVDLNHVTNGDMETFTGDTPTGWTASFANSGTTSKETTLTHAGTGALRCTTTASGGHAGPIVAFPVRSGESLKLDLWMYVPVAGIARVRITNAVTGMCLTAAGTWQVAAADCQTETVASDDYVHHTQTFTVQDYETCRADSVTLLLRCYVIGSDQSALFDDVYLYPGFNFLSVHGHNFEPMGGLAWYYADDDSAYTLVRREEARRPSFYGITTNGTVLYHRWVKAVQTDLPYTAAGSIGELVLGQYQTFLTDAMHPAQGTWMWDYFRPQVRNLTQTGMQRVTNLTNHRQRTLRLPYFQKSDASFDQFRDEIMGRCEDGGHPLVIVPDDSKQAVIFGRIPGEWQDRQGHLTTAHQTDLIVVESPFELSGL